jgi:hypothetical protein
MLNLLWRLLMLLDALTVLGHAAEALAERLRTITVPA